MPPVITALYAALNALFNIFLASNVSTLRRKHKVSIGSHPSLEVAIRAHGNNAEFMPLGMIVLLLLEMCGGNHVVLHVYGGTFLIARVAHWVGLPLKAPNVPRFMGTALTWVAIAFGAGYLLYLRFKITGGL